jgi:hypothetical protein
MSGAFAASHRRRAAACALMLALGGAQARAQAIFLTAPSEISHVEPKRALTPPPAAAPSAPKFLGQPDAKTPVVVATPAPAAPAPVATAPAPVATSSASPPPSIVDIAPPARAASAGPVVVAAPIPPRDATVLRHLTNNIQGFRLSGEIGASEWPVFLTEQQARRKLQFQIGYLAAVSVMPEASTLTLTFNDEIVGQTRIRAVNAVKTVVFDIPPGVMRPGFNAIRIGAEQRHRVDCSLEATFELWTQIDPTQTGVLLAEADAGVDTLADLGALLPDEQGALPIRAVLSPTSSLADIERMLRAVQLISVVGRFEQPAIDLGLPAQGRFGVNLVVGTAAELRGDVDLDALGVIDRPRAVVLPASPARRTTIVVTGVTAAEVDEAMKQFLVAAKPKGSAQGLRAAAAFPGFRIQAGQRVKLRDLGLTSEEFNGRLFRAAFNIIMPPDFYAADYGRASLRVAGGYASGLTSRAQLVMNVNERTAVSLALMKSSGDVFKDNPLPLPLGFLRPGLNRVEIEAHIPTSGDDHCDPLAAINAPNRFLFLDTTEIEIPPIARVARMPDLAVTASGGFPFAGAQRRPKLFLPSLNQKTIGAAATMVAHLAIAAGRPVDFELVGSEPGPGKGPTLVVAPIDALEPELLKKLDMPVKEMREAWKTQIGAAKGGASDALSQSDAMTRNRLVLQNNFPMACHPPKPTGGVKHAALALDAAPTAVTVKNPAEATAPAESEAGPRDLFAEWDAKLRSENRWTAAVAAVNRAHEWLRSKFTDAARRVRLEFQADAANALVTPQTSLAMGQNIVGEASEDVWTLVTAPNADELADGVACLVDPRVARQIAGRVSALDMDAAKINILPVAESRFIVTQPLSVGNVRLIAAGWLSLHSFSYVAGALAIALLLAAATRVFVRNVGRKA